MNRCSLCNEPYKTAQAAEECADLHAHPRDVMIIDLDDAFAVHARTYRPGQPLPTAISIRGDAQPPRQFDAYMSYDAGGDIGMQATQRAYAYASKREGAHVYALVR